MTNNQLPSIHAMHSFVHSNRILLEVAINVILLDRTSRFNQLSDEETSRTYDCEENLQGIIFEEIKMQFEVTDDNEPFEELVQLLFAHSIFTVSRKRYNGPNELCSFMQALPFSFPGELNAYVTDAYREYRLNANHSGNHFPYYLKSTIHTDLLTGHPLTPALYAFLSGFAFQSFLNQ